MLPIINKNEDKSTYIQRCMFELCVNGDKQEDEAFYMCEVEYNVQLAKLDKPKTKNKDASR
jgi:hypothetical protein